MPIRTKIVCTIGPSCSSKEMLEAMAIAGMNVARLNFSHGSHESHLEVINNIKEVRDKLNTPLAIMLDTCGPKVRIGKLQEDKLILSKGDRWKLIKDKVMGDATQVSINPPSIIDDLTLGIKVLFNDGYIASHVIEKGSDYAIVEIENNGIISSGKGVNIPGVKLNLPAIIEKDVDDIRFGCENKVDIIAMSYARTPENIMIVKDLLKDLGGTQILVIAKIENHEGVENFDSILQLVDGVMIARGDLGVEIPLSRVPKLQKEMIRKCYLVGKPAITATQMLESMITNPRPTRAEVSDVANAIYDSTSAVMLSGETAIGKYPIQTIDVMHSIIKEAEADFQYQRFFELHSQLVFNDVPSAVTLAAVQTAYSAHASAIFAFTSSGSTARLLSRLRPAMPIIAMTPQKRSFHQLALNWGVIPFYSEASKDQKESFERISQFSLDKKLVSYGDLVVVTAGSTFGISGTTNMMLVEHIGDVLVRGHLGTGEKTHANVTLVYLSENVKPYTVRGHFIVIPKCDLSFTHLIESSEGVILENQIEDNASEIFVQEISAKFNKPYVIRADGAMKILKDGQLVTLDPEKALVYKGVVF